jgi:glycosyltransferase involved in cell wall biosynthesis
MLRENNPYPQDLRVRAQARSLVAAGHSVTVVAPRGPDEPRRKCLDGVDVVRFRAFDGSTHGAIGFVLEYSLAALSLHVAAVRSLFAGATVLHIHNPPDILFGAGALFRLAGRKVVYDQSDLFPETLDVKFGAGAKFRLASIVADVFQRLSFGVANHVLATNASYAEVAAKKGGKAAGDVTIVRNGPPSAWTRLPLRAREGALSPVQLAYIGAISTQDGAEGLAPVLASLRDRPDPVDVRLTIIGDGDARPALEAELARYGVADRVTFTGWVEADQVPALLGGADVCVDPAPATNVNQRSTMIKIGEYLSLGKPVVAYDLLETRRTAAGAAMLVPPGDVETFADSIAQLARDPQLRLRMARKARRRAAQLTWEHSEHALLEAYESLSTNRGRSSLRPATRTRR